MARQRFIHPDFWTDPTIGKLAPVERLFFIGCFSNADDEGRLLGEPAFLRSTIFPYDDMTIAHIRKVRDQVVASCSNLVLYESDGVSYLAFLKWTQYQVPRYAKASKLPPPQLNTPSTMDTDEQPQACGEVEESLQPNRCNVAENWSPQIGFRLDRVGMGCGVEPTQAPTAPEDASQSERALLAVLKDIPNWPFDYAKDLAHLRELAVDFADLDLTTQVKKLRDYLKDKPLTAKSNPRLRLRNWCEKAAQWSSGGRTSTDANTPPRDSPGIARTKALMARIFPGEPQ